MSTVLDVLQKISNEQASSMFFVYSGAHLEKLNVAFKAVRAAAKKEHGRKRLENLPYDLVLGIATQTAFNEFLKVADRGYEGSLYPIELLEP